MRPCPLSKQTPCLNKAHVLFTASSAHWMCCVVPPPSHPWPILPPGPGTNKHTPPPPGQWTPFGSEKPSPPPHPTVLLGTTKHYQHKIQTIQNSINTKSGLGPPAPFQVYQRCSKHEDSPQIANFNAFFFEGFEQNSCLCPPPPLHGHANTPPSGFERKKHGPLHQGSRRSIMARYNGSEGAWHTVRYLLGCLLGLFGWFKVQGV